MQSVRHRVARISWQQLGFRLNYWQVAIMGKLRLRKTDSRANRDIRSLRLGAALSFGELARRAGVEETDLRKAERGLDLPGNGFVERVAAALGITEGDLRRAHRQLQQVATPGEGYLTARPERTFVRAVRQQPRTGLASVLDLFCGTGGF